jgi:3-hydroxyisobutyrate dehydrogenase-like beta-hydroxyacid dehydrogenase
MGQAMARNLLRAGHHLTVYNRTRKVADMLASEGAKVAASPAAVVEEIVFTMVADDAALEAVVSGPDGILNCSSKFTHVSMSTISVALSKRLAEAHSSVGQQYVAAPVFGRPEAAAAAKLVIVAAGPQNAIFKCQPAFDAMAHKHFHVGEEPEKANIIKLCGNFMLASMLETLAEAFAVLRKFGIDPKQFLEIVNGNLFRSPVYENYGNLEASGKFEPAGFKLRLGLKDVKLGLAAAEAVSVPMPIASVLRDQFLSGVARGYGEIDWAALAKVAAENAGIDLSTQMG